MYCSFALRRRGVVLMYHRVLPAELVKRSYSAAQIIVTTKTFDAQMRFLRRHFNPVTAHEFASMLRGTLPWLPRTCLVTFDDGWWDNAEYALPILARHRIPAVVFLATAYIGTQRCFWQETLTAMLCELARHGEAARAIFEELDALDILRMNEVDTRIAVRPLISKLKLKSAEEIEVVIARAQALLDGLGKTTPASETDRFMSWEQVLSLKQSGLIELGSHAHTHTPLPKLSDATSDDELQLAHRKIEQALHSPPTSFAYPNGDYHEDSIRQVDAMGYELAFTTDTGWVQPGDAPLRLRRMNISESGTNSAPGFLSRLLAWF